MLDVLVIMLLFLFVFCFLCIFNACFQIISYNDEKIKLAKEASCWNILHCFLSKPTLILTHNTLGNWYKVPNLNNIPRFKNYILIQTVHHVKYINVLSMEHSSSSDPCTQQPEPGNCLARYEMWYYSEGEDKCRQFIYGGCGGNDNRLEPRSLCN